MLNDDLVFTRDSNTGATRASSSIELLLPPAKSSNLSGTTAIDEGKEQQDAQKEEQAEEELVWTTWKSRWVGGGRPKSNNNSNSSGGRRERRKKVLRHCIDYIFYSTAKEATVSMKREKKSTAKGGDVAENYEHSSVSGAPYLRAVAALGMFSDDYIGDELLPSARYPSDHIALVADLQIVVAVKSAN